MIRFFVRQKFPAKYECDLLDLPVLIITCPPVISFSVCMGIYNALIGHSYSLTQFAGRIKKVLFWKKILCLSSEAIYFCWQIHSAY